MSETPTAWQPVDLAAMAQAFDEARLALLHDDVPVGAVLTCDGTVVARAHNRREVDHDPLAHAEILALRAASQALGRWRLHDCALYVTLEPCPMCAGALVNARLQRLVFATADPRAGCCGTLMNLADDKRFNHRVQVQSGLGANEAAALLRDFFRNKRG